MDIQATLRSALSLHQAGRVAEAEGLYRQILGRAPRHADALHFLGLAAHQRGQHAEALALMDEALRAAPDYAACHSNRGNALLALGRVDEAIGAFRAAIARKRDFADAHLNLGNALERKGLAEDAIASYRRALRTSPNSPETHYNLGRVYAGQGRLDEAGRSYRRAVALRPDYVDALFNLGNLHQATGAAAEAIDCFQRVLALRPGHAPAHNNLGAALERAGREDEAQASYRRALALQPAFPEAHNNLGNVLLAAGRTAEAIASYEAAIAARPDYAAAHNNLGNALQAAGRLDEAIARHDRALALQPDFPDATWNKAFALLLKGDFAAGWPLFEARWQLPGQRQDPAVWGKPAWRGEVAVAGRTVLVHHEQGYGDTLQMLRYVPLLAARGARVLVRVPAPLARLVATVEGVAGVLGPDEALPDFDLHCPCMSLPLAFGTRLDTIPSRVPYCGTPDADRWAARLGARHAPRVGLAWSGSATHRNDRQRSVPLAELAPLLALGAEFHSLQREYRPADAGLLAPRGPLRDHAESLGDFAGTAGLVSQLDLVITVDTAVAHLAGALGRDVWLLLPAAPDYRWLLGRADSPWYPTMRLFRQRDTGGWPVVVAEVADALRECLGS
jgi:tetratricopeptide (TPR) repeat protein